MGSVYSKRGKLWIAFIDVDGKRKGRPTGLALGEEALARRMLAMAEAKVKALRSAGETQPGTLTLARFAETWLEGRRRRGIVSVENEAGFVRNHITPALGGVLLTELRPRHVRDFLRDLQRKAVMVRAKAPAEGAPAAPPPPPRLLGSRTVRHVMGTLRCLLAEAVAEELIPTTPYQLRRRELPVRRDVDPTWRANARFSREEVERLISDERIPEDRRALYAVLFLTGCRPGEAIPLRWEHYDPTAQPLGQLQLAFAYSSAAHVVKDTKTHRTHVMPVHPTLAKVLARWRMSGWAKQEERPPRGEDLVFPSRNSGGKHRKAPPGLRNEARIREYFYKDLDLLGLRRRGPYCARHTFETLAREDGITKEDAGWLTHGPSGDVQDGYRAPNHQEMSGWMLRIRIGLRGTEPTPLRKKAAGEAPADASAPQGTATALLPPTAGEEKAPGFQDPGASSTDGRCWFRTTNVESTRENSDAQPREIPRGEDGRGSVSGALVAQSGSAVAAPPEPSDPVSAALDAAQASWERAGDADELRRRLLQVLQLLDEARR